MQCVTGAEHRLVATMRQLQDCKIECLKRLFYANPGIVIYVAKAGLYARNPQGIIYHDHGRPLGKMLHRLLLGGPLTHDGIVHTLLSQTQTRKALLLPLPKLSNGFLFTLRQRLQVDEKEWRPVWLSITHKLPEAAGLVRVFVGVSKAGSIDSWAITQACRVMTTCMKFSQHCVLHPYDRDDLRRRP